MATETPEATPAPAPSNGEDGGKTTNNDGESLADKAAKNKAKRERRKRAKQRKKAAAATENGTPGPAGTASKDTAATNGDADAPPQTTPTATTAPTGGAPPGRKNSNRNRNNNNRKNKQQQQEPAVGSGRVKELEETLKQVQAEKETMSNQLEEANKTIEALRQGNPGAAPANGTNGSAAAAVSQLEAERDDLKAQLKAAKNDLESSRASFEKELEEMKSNLAETTLKAQSQEIQELSREHENLVNEQKSIAALAGMEEEKGKLNFRVQELQKELDATKEGFAQQTVELEKNLQKVHDTQMQEAVQKQEELEAELGKTKQALKEAQANKATDTTATSKQPQGGEDVTKVWQDKLVAKAKELKDMEKRLKAVEADNRSLEMQLDKTTKEKKPWWQCG